LNAIDVLRGSRDCSPFSDANDPVVEGGTMCYRVSTDRGDHRARGAPRPPVPVAPSFSCPCGTGLRLAPQPGSSVLQQERWCKPTVVTSVPSERAPPSLSTWSRH